MERYTPQEREIFVSIFFAHNRSVVLAQREFRRRFPNRVAPTGQTFRRLATRFEQTGTTEDRARRGRHRTGRSAANIAAVAADVAENAETSIRRRATQLGITRRTLQRILLKDLHMVRPNESSRPTSVETVDDSTTNVDESSQPEIPPPADCSKLSPVKGPSKYSKQPITPTPQSNAKSVLQPARQISPKKANKRSSMGTPATTNVQQPPAEIICDVCKESGTTQKSCLVSICSKLFFKNLEDNLMWKK